MTLQKMQFEPIPFIDRWCNGEVSADLRSLYGVQFEPGAYVAKVHVHITSATCDHLLSLLSRIG